MTEKQIQIVKKICRTLDNLYGEDYTGVSKKEITAFTIGYCGCLKNLEGLSVIEFDEIVTGVIQKIKIHNQLHCQ